MSCAITNLNLFFKKSISKVCVNLFLPFLLLTSIGSHITLSTFLNYWPLIVLPIFVVTLSYAIGEGIVILFGEPNYLVPGVCFNNVTAMPLLLLEAIAHSQVLIPLLNSNETITEAVVRAKSYILLHGIIHNITRFAAGPLMLKPPPSILNPEISPNAADLEGNRAEVPTESTSILKGNIDYGTTTGASSNDQSIQSLTRINTATNSVKDSQPMSRKQSIKDVSNSFFLNKAKNLSRRSSIDFDEARDLLSGYIHKLSDAVSNNISIHRHHYEEEENSENFHQHINKTSPVEITRASTSVNFKDVSKAPMVASSSKSDSNITKQEFAVNRIQNSKYIQVPESDVASICSNGSSINLQIDASPCFPGKSIQTKQGYRAILPGFAVVLIDYITPSKTSYLGRFICYMQQFLNPAVVAAIAAVIIGIIPTTHWFFFKFSVIATSLTPSISSLGDLYPALQLFALGSKLTSPPETPVRKSTIFWITFVRFLIAPVVSIGTVWLMITYAPKKLWPQDRMLNFILMIVPAGPPAITLAAVAEIAGVKAEELSAISRMLLYMYGMAPLVAPTVAIALSIAYQIES